MGWSGLRLDAGWSDTTIVSTRSQHLLDRAKTLGRFGARLSPNYYFPSRLRLDCFAPDFAAPEGSGRVAGRRIICSSSYSSRIGRLDLGNQEHALRSVFFLLDSCLPQFRSEQKSSRILRVTRSFSFRFDVQDGHCAAARHNSRGPVVETRSASSAR